MRKFLTFITFVFCLNNLSAQSNFIHQDTIFGRTASCATGVPVCIDSVAYDSVNSFRYFVDRQRYNGSVAPCYQAYVATYSYSDIFRNNQTGPWQLDSWTVNGRTFSTAFSNLQTLADSMQRWDAAAAWRLDTTLKIIYGYPTYAPSQYSCQQISIPNNPIWQSSLCFNYGYSYKGLRLSVPSGVHQLVVEEILTGQRDTVTVVAACMSADTVHKVVVTQSSNYYCFDTSRLPAGAGTLYNLCKKSNLDYLFDAPSGSCIRYLGRRIGVDTACLMLCDNAGNCATTTLIVTTKYTFERTTRVFDTITVGATRTLKNFSEPIGSDTIRGNCYALPIRYATFDINKRDRTVSVTGLAVGTDTACFIISSRRNGYADTTLLFLTTVAAPQIMGIDTSKTYRLVVRSSQKVLSIRNASASLAADAVQADATSGLNQKWAIKNANIDAFTLSVQHTNMNLDTRWGTKRSGSRLMQWSKSASLTQQWSFIPVGNGYYKIINKASGRALSINSGTTANANNGYLVQLNYEGLTSQQWRLEPQP